VTSQLPATGTDSTGFVVGGVIVVLAGALLLAAGRRAEHR
jgi:LPXTG-motif cell wall-anchored protein